MFKKIIVNINKNGSINIETDNFKGESCVSAIKELFEEFLELDNFDLKSSYYENEESLTNEVNVGL